MTSFLLQLLGFFHDGRIHLFLLFFLFVQAFWWVRVYIARRNKRYVDVFRGSVSVVVAVLREDHDLFERCLASIKKYSRPVELIVSIDDYTHADSEIRRIAKKYATRVIEQPALMGKREQYALATEALVKKVDVILTVDSDTLWDDSTMNILKPFNNPLVGGVVGRQTIFKADTNTIRRMAQWFEDLRFRVTLPFQSYFGQVNVMPGRTLAVRASLYKKIAQKVRHETFLGRRIITSDDASVTMEVLRSGYEVVYQDDSNVTTDAPSTMYGFTKQYLRWYRGSYRRFFSRCGQLLRMNPLVFLSNFEFLFAVFVYAGIFATFVFKLVFNVYEFDDTFGFKFTESFNTTFVLLLVLGYLLSSFVRNLPHLLHSKRDIFFLPLFAFITFLLITPLKVIAAFTMFENGWMTRASDKQHHERGVISTRMYAGILAVCITVLTFPLAYVCDVMPMNVPFDVIVKGDGPAYAKAREIIASYQSPGMSPESVQNITHLYEKRPGVGPKFNELAATCVQESLLDDATRYDVSRPLQLIDACQAKALSGTYKTRKFLAWEASVKKQTELYVLTAESGDSQSSLIRSLVMSDSKSKSLTSAQKAYVENQLVKLLGRNDTTRVGERFTITHLQFVDVVYQAKHLTPLQENAWASFAFVNE